jgi:hypothetical protein
VTASWPQLHQALLSPHIQVKGDLGYLPQILLGKAVALCLLSQKLLLLIWQIAERGLSGDGGEFAGIGVHAPLIILHKF